MKLAPHPCGTVTVDAEPNGARWDLSTLDGTSVASGAISAGDADRGAERGVCVAGVEELLRGLSSADCGAGRRVAQGAR